MPTAATASTSRGGNGFDLIRLLAAITVVWGHSLTFMGISEPWLFGRVPASNVAVLVFFSISGYLVTESWLRDPSVPRFLARRALRIFPALLATLVFTAFVVGPLFSSQPAAQYLTRPEPWLYVLRNVTTYTGSDALPGLFTANPYPQAVNAPLWTLGYELAFYFCLAGLAWVCGRRLTTGLLFTAIATGIAWYHWVGPVQIPLRIQLPVLWRIDLPMNSYLPYFAVFFLIGALLRTSRRAVPWHPAIALALFAACWLERQSPFFMLLLWLAVPYTTILCGTSMPARWGAVTRNRDLSYGMYVYACPIQQSVVSVLAPLQWGWIATWIAALPLVGLAAWLSWRFVEQPALALKTLLPNAGAATPLPHPAPQT